MDLLQHNPIAMNGIAERELGEEADRGLRVRWEAPHRLVAGRVQAHRHAVDGFDGRQQVRRTFMACPRN
jgi:hypothetical protein